MSDTEACPSCGSDYHSLGQHWSMSDCSFPKLTERQKNIVVGLMMGDGSLNYGKKNPIVQIQCIKKEYLEYLDNIFGCLGQGISFVKSAKESSKAQKDGKVYHSGKEENFSDVYGWYTRTHPSFKQFDWYTNEGKIWPEKIDLTPETLKHWYCGDGTWNNKSTNNYIQISMTNEIENTDKVDNLFEKIGLPTPSNYNILERDLGFLNCQAQFSVKDSEKLWEYMGEPPNGYEYKWPEKYH